MALLSDLLGSTFQGSTGPIGLTPNITITVGTVTDGATGSNAIVTNTGITSGNAVFNFTIPRGNTEGLANIAIINSNNNDFVEFDDISSYTDNFLNNFDLSFNTTPVANINPFAILVSINGAVQPAFEYNADLVWGQGIPPVFSAYSGYTIVPQTSNIIFTESLTSGSQVYIRRIPGFLSTLRKIYPFKPTDIVMGY